MRNKFLLSLALISALLTSATLLLLRQRVAAHATEEIAAALQNSIVTFRSMQDQRESTLERSAALLAALPPVKAVMTTQDSATIQDASATFWKLAGSQLFVLANRSGKIMAFHGSLPEMSRTEVQQALSGSIQAGTSRDWWFEGKHLYQIFVQPISFSENTPMGVLAVGYEIDANVAEDVSRVASGRVVFRYGKRIVVGSADAGLREDLERELETHPPDSRPQSVQLGREKFLATSITLDPMTSTPVTMTVLKSFDEATAYLDALNQWIILVGFSAVVIGSLLVFVVSTTFTRPIQELSKGVHALERGDFAYPLKMRGTDEVSALTQAFDRMRSRLRETQDQLLDSERLATIGRMASMISHDLRHPLTAILAYSEFLSEQNLSESQRKDFFQEIRLAVNRMTDEINSLLGFSKQREKIRPVFARMDQIIDRAIQAVKVLPEFSSITIIRSITGDCEGWFDPPKVERVITNLLFNACEVVSPELGRIEILCAKTESGLEIRIADNGPGIPPVIQANLFQPFVSHGKAKGIGLGLTVVRKIMHDHGGDIQIERTGPQGTTFVLTFPGVCELNPSATQA